MSRRAGARNWVERQVRLTKATVTTFTGPGQEYLAVVSGKLTGTPRVMRQTVRGGRAKGNA